MVSKEQLNEIGFKSSDNYQFYDWGSFNIMFNIKTQKVFTHDEVYGVCEEICIIRDIDHLIEVYELMFGSLK